MKKRIGAVFLLIVVLISCFSFAATATTKRGVLHEHDKWVYNTKLISGVYKSSYTDCTALNCIDTVDWYAYGNTHGTRATNNQDGLSSGWVYAKHTKTAVATVKANWFGKAGTAQIKLLYK